MGKSKEMFTNQREAEMNGVDITQERKETDLIHQLNISQDSIGLAVMNAVEAVRSGNMNPLEALLRLKSLEKFVEDTYTQLKKDFLDEADKYSGKEFSFMGCEIKKTEAGTRYDYAGAEYTKWSDLKEALKKTEALMRSAIESDIYDGDGVKIPAPVKSSTSTLSVKIK